MVTIGFPCINRSLYGAAKNWTNIYPFSTVDTGGILTSWCIYIVDYPAISAKLKIFRDDGTNFNFVGESSAVSLSIGNNPGLTCNITVQAGDILGIYFSASGTDNPRNKTGYISGTTGYWQRVGDISINSAKTTWTNLGTTRQYHSSIQAIGPSTGTKYVDISTGNDSDSGDTWDLAYLTVKKGIDNVAAGKKIHIAEGDYSAQATINLNKNLDLVCEDYGGGNASPPLTVTLPPTT